MVVPFSMLLNLASVVGAENKGQLWGFIKRYASDAAPDTNTDLDAAVEFSVRYYNDFVKPTKTYRAPSNLESEALVELLEGLKTWNKGLDPDALQSLVFSCGRERFDPMRDWFKALYEVLLGASQGPRFGGFLALLGIEESIALIEKCLNGDLSQS
jgi:lysyl-tRNA synthetase class 1